MSVEERRRHALYRSLLEVHGPENTETMFAMFPPTGSELATVQDLRSLEQRLDARFAHVDERFARIDERFARIDERFDHNDARTGERFDHVNDKLDLLATQLVELRRDLGAAVAGQTRAMFLGIMTSVASVGGLAYVFGQVL